MTGTDGQNLGRGTGIANLADRNTPAAVCERRELHRCGDLSKAGEAFRTVDHPEQMPADAVVFEELGVGLEPLTDDRRSLGRLIDFDEDPRRGVAGVDDHELVGLHSVELRDLRLGPPELDEPRIVANERSHELDAIERVTNGHEPWRSVWGKAETASSGFAQSISHGDSATFGRKGLSSNQAIEPELAGSS
jgi:hypothetical protein